MTKLVTIGIPVYRRLDFLPHVLNIVSSQVYPDIELIVSDNGMNGSAVHDIVKKYYSRPIRFRQNSSTVGMSIHFNQIIHEASGEYFVLLADDDEISSNYVSELVTLLERHTRASVAMSIQETIDETGVPLRRSSEKVPEMLTGPDFIRAAWGTHEYGYESFSTFVGRTANLVNCGGYPDFYKGTALDDALIVKLCFDNFVVFSTRCTFRKRYSEASDGYAMGIKELSRGLRDFLAFLESDPMIRAYAVSQRQTVERVEALFGRNGLENVLLQMDRFVQKKTDSPGVGSRGILHALYSRLLPCRGADIYAKRCRRRAGET